MGPLPQMSPAAISPMAQQAMQRMRGGNNFWAPPGLGFNTPTTGAYYSNPQGATVPFSLPAGDTFQQARQAIQGMLQGGNAAALDAYFKGYTPAAGSRMGGNPRNMQWLKAYLAGNPGAGGQGGNVGPGGGVVDPGNPFVQPGQGWGYTPGSGPLLPSTGKPMY